MPKVDKEKLRDNIDCCCNDKSQFTSICASTLGIFLVLAVLFLIFAKSELALLVPIVWAFIVLGFFAMMFAYKSMKK
jgi:hypothetical protein